ncbi:MAG: VOC family protein [Xanthobacteraceae bacterium]|jgi:catechol 2,3-dioxygenase-like lactoylglutathione lyase family enzyme
MATPISSLDHVTVLTRDLSRAVDDATALLGRKVSWRSGGEGVSTAIFTLANTSLEIVAPDGAGAQGDRVRAALDQRGEGLASACFRVTDIDRLARRLSRLQLQPEAVVEATSTDALTGAVLRWRRTRIPAAAANGVRLFFLQRDDERPLSEPSDATAVTGLDHLVITVRDPERAAAFYGARLGLDMRLDLSRADWGARLMFFRCGDMIVELAKRLDDAADSEPAKDDKFMGLSWRVANADAARGRLAAAGFDVSEVRAGRKPNTRLFTVRNRNGGVPTLMIQPAPR